MPTPLLTIDGVQIQVQVEGAVNRPDIVAGTAERAFDGSLLSTVHATRKREWEFTLLPMEPEDSATFRAAINAGVVEVGGRFITDLTTDPIDALVTITAHAYVKVGLGLYRDEYSILIQEA